jgi:hypothetical protein
MSIVTVEEAKRVIVITHNFDDERLQQLLDDAEEACRQFLGVDRLPREGTDCPDECDTASTYEAASDAEDLPAGIRRGVILLVQADYEGKDITEREKMRDAAERCWWPYRCGLGV